MMTTPCPYCHSPAQPHWPGVQVWRCPACDLRFRWPLPDADALAAAYQTAWERPSANTYTGATDAALAAVYRRRLAQLAGVPPLAGQRLLEFGAGQGAMLAALAAAGAEVQAVEPYGAAFLQAQGWSVWPALSALPPQTPLFDGILTMQVVEHVAAPWHTLAQLAQWLKPGGWLYVSTIHAGSLHARLRGPRWREVQNRAHLIFFTPRSLAVMLRRAGLSRVQRVKGFIRYPHHNRSQQGRDWLLQQLGWGGELCYLAFRPESGDGP